MLSTTPSVPHSTLFQAPGSPVEPATIAEVRQVLARELADAVADQGLRLEPSADPSLQVLRGNDLSLSWLCDFAESALKRAIRRLPADLIGGPNVTRLDGTLNHRHPRLPYRRALRIVASRGWRLSLGDELGADAEASLVRFCGLLPVQIMFLPGQPQPESSVPSRPGVSYVLPWGGEVLRGELPEPGAGGPAVCRFHLDRLVQFVLGLEAADVAQA